MLHCGLATVVRRATPQTSSGDPRQDLSLAETTAKMAVIDFQKRQKCLVAGNKGVVLEMRGSACEYQIRDST